MTATESNAIEQLVTSTRDMLEAEWPHIAEILSDDSEVSLGFSGVLKMGPDGKRILGALRLSYARKFKHEVEFMTPDFDQGELPIK